MYDRIDPNDQQAVIWLQLALAKLVGGSGAYAEVGKLSAPTAKAIRLFQLQHGLATTGEADEATLSLIKQELGKTS